MTHFVGVDPGIAWCGVALVGPDGDLVDVGVWTSTKGHRTGDEQQRLLELLRWLRVRVYGWSATVLFSAVAVEYPLAGGRNAGEQRATKAASLKQVAVAAGGALGLLGELTSAPLYAPVPVTWRAAVSGTRTTGKVIQAELDADYRVSQRVGRTRAPHALDALGLALYARRTWATQALRDDR